MSLHGNHDICFIKYKYTYLSQIEKPILHTPVHHFAWCPNDDVFLQFCPSRNYKSENNAPCCCHLTILHSARIKEMQKSISDVQKHTGLFTPKYVIMVCGRGNPSQGPVFPAHTAKPYVYWGGDNEFTNWHTLNLWQPRTYTNWNNEVHGTGSPLSCWYSVDQEKN